MSDSSDPDDAPRDFPLLAVDVRGQAFDELQFSGRLQAQASRCDLQRAAFGHADKLRPRHSWVVVREAVGVAARSATRRGRCFSALGSLGWSRSGAGWLGIDEFMSMVG